MNPPDERLREIAALLASPAKITPAILRVKVLALCEGREVPGGRREWLALAERAGVKHCQRYTSWAQISADKAGQGPSDDAPLALPPSVRRRSKPVGPALYRYYDDTDRLLYIGISDELTGRVSGHSKGSPWMDFAVRSTITRYPSRAKAAAAEVEAIKSEQPLFNLKHNNTPEARRRLFEYLVEHGRTDIPLPCISREQQRLGEQTQDDTRNRGHAA